MEKALFFCGIHGSGKTQAIQKLTEETGLKIFKSLTQEDNPYEKLFQRQAWGITKKYLDALNILDQQKNVSPYEFLLVDSSILDLEAYTKTFYLLGWLSGNEYKKLEDLRKVHFDNSFLIPRNIVFFFPPDEWLKARIHDTLDDKGRRLREEDAEYLKILKDQYNEILKREKYNSNILILTETDISDRVNEIKKFIDKIK